MVNITKRNLLSLRKELQIAIDYLDKLISDLRKCNKETNWTLKIGKIASEMPDLKLLAELGIQALQCIWKIRNGEMKIEEAIGIFTNDKKQLSEALEVFKM